MVSFKPSAPVLNFSASPTLDSNLVSISLSFSFIFKSNFRESFWLLKRLTVVFGARIIASWTFGPDTLIFVWKLLRSRTLWIVWVPQRYGDEILLRWIYIGIRIDFMEFITWLQRILIKNYCWTLKFYYNVCNLKEMDKVLFVVHIFFESAVYWSMDIIYLALILKFYKILRLYLLLKTYINTNLNLKKNILQ